MSHQRAPIYEATHVSKNSADAKWMSQSRVSRDGENCASKNASDAKRMRQ